MHDVRICIIFRLVVPRSALICLCCFLADGEQENELENSYDGDLISMQAANMARHSPHNSQQGRLFLSPQISHQGALSVFSIWPDTIPITRSNVGYSLVLKSPTRGQYSFLLIMARHSPHNSQQGWFIVSSQISHQGPTLVSPHGNNPS